MKPSELHPKCPLGTHPLADMLPMLDDKQVKDFVETIEVNGKIHTPIVILRSGSPIGDSRTYTGPDSIIDGRNRVKYGMHSGIKWDDIPNRDYLLSEDGPVGQFVVREGIKGRRHLDDISRAICASNLAKEIAASLKAAEPKAAPKPAADKPAATPGDSAEAGPVKTKRISHEAREQAAKQLGISVDAVKKATAYGKHEDLTKAVKSGKMSQDAAAAEAARRRQQDSEAKHEQRIIAKRKEALAYIKNTFGDESVFLKKVQSKKSLGDNEKNGPKALETFIELKLENQRAIIPLLIDGLTLTEAQAIFAQQPSIDATAQTLIHRAITQQLAVKESVVFRFGDYSITVSATKDELRNLKRLVTK